MKTNIQEMATRMGYITEEEFIDLAGITASTAEAWRKRGQGPAYSLLGNKYYYSYDSVADTLAGKQRPSASDYAITRHRVVVNGVDIGTVAELPGGALRARLEIRSIICNAVLPIFGPGIV